MIFAWGAAYNAISEEGDHVEADNHVAFYHMARSYLGDIIDCKVDVEVISCLCLMSLYLLMTHKPYK